MTYEEYMRSDLWRQKRQQRLELDKFQCRGCGCTNNEYPLEVHHKPQSYARIPHEDVNDDLTTLCAVCHKAITSVIRKRRYQGKSHNISFIEQPKERIITNVEKGDLSIDWTGPVDFPQRTTSRSNKQMV